MEALITLTSVLQSRVVLLSYSRKLLDNGNVEIITATSKDIYNEVEKEHMQRHIEFQHIGNCDCDEQICRDTSSIEISFAFWVNLNSIVNSRLQEINYDYHVSDIGFNPPDMPRFRFEIPRRISCQYNADKTVDSLDIYKCSYILADIEYPYICIDHYLGNTECYVRLPPAEDIVIRPICTMYNSTSDTADEISTSYSKKTYIGFAD